MCGMREKAPCITSLVQGASPLSLQVLLGSRASRPREARCLYADENVRDPSKTIGTTKLP